MCGTVIIMGVKSFSRLAIISFLCGLIPVILHLVAFFQGPVGALHSPFLFRLVLLASPLILLIGVILSIVAFRLISRYDQSGKWLALTGVILNGGLLFLMYVWPLFL